jgi:hypothetical protein
MYTGISAKSVIFLPRSDNVYVLLQTSKQLQDKENKCISNNDKKQVESKQMSPVIFWLIFLLFSDNFFLFKKTVWIERLSFIVLHNMQQSFERKKNRLCLLNVASI